MRLWAAAVFALLLACAAHAGEFQGRPVEITDGRTQDRPAPLVVVLHGFTGSGAAMQRKTRFDALARRDGFVVAYPNARARRWNDRGQGRPDDVAYLGGLIDALINEGRADPARIYLAGHSNGGAMALRMACTQPWRLAGIAVVAMNALAEAPCHGAAPLPAIFIHGSVDPVVPARGLPDAGILSVKETLAIWAARNGCQPVPVREIINSSTARRVATFTRYTTCRAALVQMVIAGQGHEWPGAGVRARWIQGPASSAVDAAALSWWFFGTTAPVKSRP